MSCIRSQFIVMTTESKLETLLLVIQLEYNSFLFDIDISRTTVADNWNEHRLRRMILLGICIRFHFACWHATALLGIRTSACPVVTNSVLAVCIVPILLTIIFYLLVILGDLLLIVFISETFVLPYCYTKPLGIITPFQWRTAEGNFPQHWNEATNSVAH